MSRDQARIGTSLWSEATIRDLSVDEQWLYLHLLTQPDLNRCGVVSWRPARIARFAAGMTAARVKRVGKSLTASRHLVVDDEWDEAFVRTFVLHDGLLRQPIMVAGLARDYAEIASPVIRAALADELVRVWGTGNPADRKGLLLLASDHPRVVLAGWRKEALIRLGTSIGSPAVKDLREAIRTAQQADPHAEGLEDPLPPEEEDPHADPHEEALARPSEESWKDSSTATTTSPASSSSPSPAAAPPAQPAPPRTPPRGGGRTRPQEPARTRPTPVADVHDSTAAETIGDRPGEPTPDLVRIAARVLRAGDGNPGQVATAITEWRRRRSEQAGTGPGLLVSLIADAAAGTLRPPPPDQPRCRRCGDTLARPAPGLLAIERTDDPGSPDIWGQSPWCSPGTPHNPDRPVPDPHTPAGPQ